MDYPRDVALIVLAFLPRILLVRFVGKFVRRSWNSRRLRLFRNALEETTDCISALPVT